jgi:hypothetical protein
MVEHSIELGSSSKHFSTTVRNLLDVVDPTRAGPRDELFGIQPQRVPVGSLVAPVAHRRALVQTSLKLAATITGH